MSRPSSPPLGTHLLWESAARGGTYARLIFRRIEADAGRLDTLIAELSGKDLNEIIAAGSAKLASVPSGGGAASSAAAPAAAAGGDAPAAEKAVEKVEEKEESDDDMVSFDSHFVEYLADAVVL